MLERLWKRKLVEVPINKRKFDQGQPKSIQDARTTGTKWRSKNTTLLTKVEEEARHDLAPI